MRCGEEKIQFSQHYHLIKMWITSTRLITSLEGCLLLSLIHRFLKSTHGYGSRHHISVAWGKPGDLRVRQGDEIEWSNKADNCCNFFSHLMHVLKFEKDDVIS